jgi:cytoskeletal protein CcmA (bactofilin family)
VFKKVIGQEVSGNDRSVSSSDYEAPERVPAVASHAPSQVAATTTAAGRNILSSDVEIKGTVKFINDLVVDGKIEGEITSSGNLTVGENARIKAEIRTGTVTVYGKVHGNITAATHVELKASAEVIGDIKAATLSMEAGAIFVGKSTVGAAAQVASSAPASPTPAAAAPAAVKQANLLDAPSAAKPQASSTGA